MDCSPPGPSVRGILQARILEWVAMPSFRESSWTRDQTCISYVSCIGRGIFTTSATWEAQRRPMAVQVGWARKYSSCHTGSECALTAACEDWWFLILFSCRKLWTQVMRNHKQQSLGLVHQTPNRTPVGSFSFGVISFPEKENDSRAFWYFHSDVTIRRPRQGHDLHIDYPSQDCTWKTI